MADKKISALTSATLPLAGTEVLPIVQSGATVKVAVSDLTAARAVSMKSATVVGVADSLAESVRTNSFSGAVNGNSGVKIAAQCSDVKYNWLLAAQYNINQGFEITASTAVGGGTFSTPILSMVAPGGDVTVGTGNLVIGTSGKGITLPGGITWTSGSGSPEAAVTAPVGSLYSRSDGGLLTSLYVKESGAGNTGWVGK